MSLVLSFSAFLPFIRGGEVGSSLSRPVHAHVCAACAHGAQVFDLPVPLLTKEGARW